MVPGVGEVADGLNAVIYLAEGNKTMAALSLAAMIPIAGAGVTVAKIAKNSEKAVGFLRASTKVGARSVDSGSRVFAKKVAAAAPLQAGTANGDVAARALKAAGSAASRTAGTGPTARATAMAGTSKARAGARLSTGSGLERGSGSLVREVNPDENLGALCDELCSLTYASGREHALVKTTSGFQIQAGGEVGIDLGADVTQVLAHTHPYHLPALGPSADDVAMLHQLGQRSSILLEHGQTILFGREGTIAWR